MTMLENLSSYKQKPTQTNAFYKTQHQTLHKNKKYAVYFDDNSSLWWISTNKTINPIHSLSLSLILSFGFCFFFLTPILHKLSITVPWAFSLLNPPLISLSLQFYAVWVFLLQPQWEFHSFHGFSSYPFAPFF